MTKEEKNDICSACKLRQYYARVFDFHFNWVDCPYSCNKIQEDDEGSMK